MDTEASHSQSEEMCTIGLWAVKLYSIHISSVEMAQKSYERAYGRTQSQSFIPVLRDKRVDH